jgi:hypothetical protein
VDAFPGRDIVDGIDVGGFSLTMDEGDVNVWWNLD